MDPEMSEGPSLVLSLVLSFSLPLSLSKLTHTHTHADSVGNNSLELHRQIQPKSLLSPYLGWEWVGSARLGMPSLGVDAFAEQSGSAYHTRVQENTWGSQSTPNEACLCPHHFVLTREFGRVRWARLGHLDGIHGVLRPVSVPQGQLSRA